MKIQYRIKNGAVEVVRCFGTGETIILPEEIEGKIVRSVAPYTFSAKKRSEDTDVLEYRTEDDFLEEDMETILAGEKIWEVVFPETVQEIGNYLFYGCRELRKVTCSDRLERIGSGAFTGCGKLRELEVSLTVGEKSCIKEILGDLWQRIDVTFYRKNIEADSEEEKTEVVKLVFPEHYEEAVENTPARILFTQHHGIGNNYRQCFYDRKLDYQKYDELFGLAKAQEAAEVLEDLVFWRMQYPYQLSERARKGYEMWLLEHLKPVAEHLAETEQIDRLSCIGQWNLWKKEVLDEVIVCAAEQEKAEITGFLMNERQKFFPEVKETRKKKRRFEL